jgi:hypothetical protein
MEQDEQVSYSSEFKNLTQSKATVEDFNAKSHP